ncbi:MAG: hypothetical protein ABWK01_01045 [Infirmifilum sp.]
MINQIKITLELPVSDAIYEALKVDDYSTETIKIFSEKIGETVNYVLVFHPKKIGEVKGIVNEVLRLVRLLEHVDSLTPT